MDVQRNVRVQVGDYILPTVNAFSVERTLESVKEMAVVRFANTDDGYSKTLEDKVRRGNYITIDCGWGDAINNEFRGFVTQVRTGGDFSLQAEGYAYLFRITKIQEKQFEAGTTAKEVLNYLVAIVNSKQRKLLPKGQRLKVVLDKALDRVVMDKFIITPQTAFSVLMRVQAMVGYPLYFRDTILCLYRRFVQDNTVKGKVVDLNVETNINSFNLEYYHKEDREYIVQYIATDPFTFNRVVGEASTNDLGEGQLIFKQYPYPFSKVGKPYTEPECKELLEQMANNLLEAVSYDGFGGTISLWIDPYVDRGYIIDITDEKFESRRGRYYIVAYSLSFQTQGNFFKNVYVGQLKD